MVTVIANYFLFKCPWQNKGGTFDFFKIFGSMKSDNLGLNRTRGLGESTHSTYLCIFKLDLW